MDITIQDHIYAKVDRKDIATLTPILSFQASCYRKVFDQKQKRMRMKKQSYLKPLIDREGYFLLGYIDRVLDYLGEKGVNSTVKDLRSQNPPLYKVISPAGITLRKDQTSIVSNCLQAGRGLIQSPTGSGKTILSASLVYSFGNIPTVFLCHTLTLAKQTVSEFRKVGLNPTQFTGEERILSGLVVGTIQSFSKLEPEVFLDFQMIIVDEAHHISSLDTVYGKTLRLIPAPYKFGFTATIPSQEEHILAMEGLIGPVIGELTLQEGIEQGILAKPKLHILKSPINQDVTDLRKYQDVYEMGVVRNYPRNHMLMKKVKELSDERKTTLILVNKIQHGEILERIGNRLKIRIKFIQGRDSGDVRELLREALNSKSVDCVIATTIWKEGVNIPSLDCVINAGGGKSEIATLQSIGRGLRTTKDKTEVLLIDIFDRSHHFLINHFGERLCIYIDQGWV